MSDVHQQPENSSESPAEEYSSDIEERLAYYAHLEENTYDAFIATDENLLVKAWNRGAERMYGIRAEEALGRDAREVVTLEMSDEELAGALREKAESGRLRAEQVLHREDGTPIYVDSLTIAMRDEQGEITGYLAINRDITERKRTQERLEEAREAERGRMARDLHDEALQELSGAMAHAQLLRTRPEAAERRLEQLSAALERTERRVRAAVYDLGLGGEEDKPFTELLENLIEIHREMAPEIEISLGEAQGPDLSEPLGRTGTELLRIIGEALTNVRRHSGARSVRVVVRTTDGTLRAEVQDDGRGFNPERMISDDAAGGTGTRGMRERARALGATIKIESEPAMGTRVCFELALKENQEAPGGKVRVLLVEDHAAVREAIASAFGQERGFEVVGQAESLAEARRLLAYGPVDVAIVDLVLPDGNGGDLIKELREANQQPQALVLSASRDRAQIASAVEAGAAGVLDKTTHLDEVVESVRRLRAGETLIPLEEVVELLRFAGSQREEEYEARQAIARLSTREMEVLQLLAQGLDSEGIAEQLHISLRTERNHMASVLKKLGVHSQLQALIFALRYGVVEIP
jgi:PAS domain S-box-containing protein